METLHCFPFPNYMAAGCQLEPLKRIPAVDGRWGGGRTGARRLLSSRPRVSSGETWCPGDKAVVKRIWSFTLRRGGRILRCALFVSLFFFLREIGTRSSDRSGISSCNIWSPLVFVEILICINIRSLVRESVASLEYSLWSELLELFRWNLIWIRTVKLFCTREDEYRFEGKLKFQKNLSPLLRNTRVLIFPLI